MRTRKSVQQCLLAATLAATPVYVVAAETAPNDRNSEQSKSEALRPVDGAALKTVPQSNRDSSGIQLTQYQPDANQQRSTVNGELRKLFHKNGQSMPSMRPQDLPNTNSPTIRMVRHKTDASRPSALPDEEAKKPGLLKRFLNTFKAKTPNQGDGLTAPDQTGHSAIPAVPPPPPIVFEENSDARQTSNSVPAQTAGYQKGNGQSVFGANRPSAATVSDQNTAQAPIPQPPLPPTNTPLTSQPAAQTPAGSDAGDHQKPQHQVIRGDSFVVPFDEPDLASEEDTLLDLDSLINEPGIARNENQSPAQNTDESLVDQNPIVQESAAGPQPSLPPQAAERDLPNSPLTGYQLNTNGQVSTEQYDESTSSSQAPVVVTRIQPARVPKQNQEPETAAVQTEREVGQTADMETQSQIVRIPLLEPQDTSLSQVTPKADRAPSAEAVTEGRELATPIELKPEPERLRQLSDNARREAQLYRIMSRTGQAGFKGFCPVVLRNKRELRDGRKEFQSTFGLMTYNFSSPEAKSAFDANPARYAPAGGGSDVVLLVNTNEEVAGILDFSLWYNDRLYMFRSQETQAIFSQDPQKYSSQY